MDESLGAGQLFLDIVTAPSDHVSVTKAGNKTGMTPTRHSDSVRLTLAKSFMATTLLVAFTFWLGELDALSQSPASTVQIDSEQQHILRKSVLRLVPEKLGYGYDIPSNAMAWRESPDPSFYELYVDITNGQNGSKRVVGINRANSLFLDGHAVEIAEDSSVSEALRHDFSLEQEDKIELLPSDDPVIDEYTPSFARIITSKQTYTIMFYKKADGRHLLVGSLYRILPENQTEKQIARLKTSILPKIGSRHARTTIVEFFDYECSVCAAADPPIRSLLKELDLSSTQVIFADLPLTYHTWAKQAAKVDICVNRIVPGGYIGFRSNVYSHQDEFTETNFYDRIRATFALLKLPASKILNCANSAYADSALALSQDVAKNLTLAGTPTMYVNSNGLLGPTHIEEMRELIRHSATGKSIAKDEKTAHQCESCSIHER